MGRGKAAGMSWNEQAGRLAAAVPVAALVATATATGGQGWWRQGDVRIETLPPNIRNLDHSLTIPTAPPLPTIPIQLHLLSPALSISHRPFLILIRVFTCIQQWQAAS